jgi:hypothetical protein
MLEKCYTFDVVFGSFLGLDFRVEQKSDMSCNTLIYSSTNQKLKVCNHLFCVPEQEWLAFGALPKSELLSWKLPIELLNIDNIAKRFIPIIYGDDPNDSKFYASSNNEIRLGLDIFGSIFFMLTRYEEYVKPDRDKFDRFPATASLAHQEGFLHRPIVNEYIEILWACMKKLWPGLKRKSRQFQMHVSHDVDNPYQFAFLGLDLLSRNLIGDLVKRYNPRQAVTRGCSWVKVNKGNLAADPFNTFDWLMNISESHSLRSAFYFITDKTNCDKDGDYSIDHPLMQDLLKEIHQRGHEIGLHPSFNTYLDLAQTRKEFQKLKQICAEAGIEQETWGGRQHYLRWHNPITWRNWDGAGLYYDSTLTFPETAGFRCGTCYEFPVYDLVNRKALDLIERPLIVMECSVLADCYMAMANDLQKAFEYIIKLKDNCKEFRGSFTLLWHNNNFGKPELRELYQEILKA